MESLKITKRQLEIIKAAGKILTKSGASGLTIKKLANEMQFSEGALYRHFKSKDEIMVSMLKFLAADMDERIAAAIKDELSPVENFVAIFESQFNFFQKNPHFAVSVFTDGLMEESGNINLAIKKIMAVKYKYLLAIISAGQKQGLFIESIDSKQLIHIVMGTFRLIMFKWRIGGFTFDIKIKGNETIQSLLTLMRTT